MLRTEQGGAIRVSIPPFGKGIGGNCQLRGKVKDLNNHHPPQALYFLELGQNPSLEKQCKQSMSEGKETWVAGKVAL